MTAPPQASRAGLITSLVIFVILWMTSTFLAMKFHTEWQGEIKNREIAIKALTPAATTDVVTKDEDVKAVIAAAQLRSTALAPITGIEEAIQERKQAVKLIEGVANASVEAVKNDTERYTHEVSDIMKKDPATKLTDDNILINEKILANRVVELLGNLTAAQADTTAAKAATAALSATQTTQLAAKDTIINGLNDQIKKLTDEGTTREGKITAVVKGQDDAAKQDMTLAHSASDAATNETKKFEHDLKVAQDKNVKLEDLLAKFRLNPTRALLQPAGTITRVPGNNTVFINLGQGKEVFPGLTFQVYDKKKGLPALTDPNPDSKDELLPGKASIEVVRVLADTSECRIIRVNKGQTITEGDLILNLIYNTHTKFAFYIHGMFDVGNVGPATIEGRDVLRHMVTQWGGKSMDRVTIDTDFVVLGKEVIKPADLDASAGANEQEKYQLKLKEYEAYEKVVSDAAKYHIPILNQNRFLYFIGYYDQKNR
jgi:hypothetical protein